MHQGAHSHELCRGVVVSAGTFGAKSSDLGVVVGASLMAIGLCDGEMRLASHGREIRLLPGAAIVARPRAVALLRARGTLVGLAITVDTTRLSASTRDACASLGVPLEKIEALLDQNDGVCEVARSSELALSIARTCSCACQGDVARLRLQTLDFCSRVAGQLLEGGRERTPSGSHRRIAERAARAMREGLDAPKTIPALARICDTSPTILKESFREVYGEPVHAWYRRMRIMVASRRLLESPDSIAEVALSVGYANPSKFAKAFFDTMGVTPSSWRRSMGRPVR